MVAHHPVAHFVGRRLGVLGQQGRRRGHLARRADAALEPTVTDERFLHGRERAIFLGEASSTVVTEAPSTKTAGIRQDDTSLPSTSTLQAPQTPTL